MMYFACRKTLITISSIALLTLTLSLYAQENRQERKAQNLKVLPKDMPHAELDKLMGFYCTSLNVKCNYCHADSKTRPGRLDFAEDSASRHKGDARRMIELTYDINEKYFDVKREAPASSQAVNCYTCHRGEEMPIVSFDSIAAKHR